MNQNASGENGGALADEEIVHLLWNWWFITIFTRTCRWVFTWASCIQLTPIHCTIFIYIGSIVVLFSIFWLLWNLNFHTQFKSWGNWSWFRYFAVVSFLSFMHLKFLRRTYQLRVTTFVIFSRYLVRMLPENLIWFFLANVSELLVYISVEDYSNIENNILELTVCGHCSVEGYILLAHR
jgi:hypothetical protein